MRGRAFTAHSHTAQTPSTPRAAQHILQPYSGWYTSKGPTTRPQPPHQAQTPLQQFVNTNINVTSMHHEQPGIRMCHKQAGTFPGLFVVLALSCDVQPPCFSVVTFKMLFAFRGGHTHRDTQTQRDTETHTHTHTRLRLMMLTSSTLRDLPPAACRQVGRCPSRPHQPRAQHCSRKHLVETVSSSHA